MMRGYVAFILISFISAVPLGAGDLGLCAAGTCEHNLIVQEHTLLAESGWPPGYEDLGGSFRIDQIQSACAAVLGEENTVLQTNQAEAYGTEQTQLQDSIALVVGSSNYVSQENNAIASGVTGAYGSHETQSQRNLLLAIGCHNIAGQTNTAKAYSDAYPIEQTQSNVALLLGKGSWLSQSNAATATIFKEINVDPYIRQTQRNIAFAINNCEDCDLDTFTEFCWAASINPPATGCMGGDC
ncbi:MAG: hypothetical protein QUS09_06320 [Methanotrichaceae archaeon]|nr:hypothetical protein [Methanotrichaceae archaeon]